jgi:putative transposase
VEHVRAELGLSERRVCRVLGQPRSTQRKIPTTSDDEAALTADIIALALQYGRYGYRRITALLPEAGWRVNKKRVERIWRQEGLKVPQKHPKRGRLWLGDGSCIRLRPEYPNHVWSYDFVEDRTHDGRKFRMLNIIDEFTRECLAIRVSRKLSMSSTCSRTCSSCAVFPAIFGPITAANSWPKRSASGSRLWGPRRHTSSRAARGRTVTARASTRSSGTNC